MLDIPLTMLHEHLNGDNIPFFPCPDGYRVRSFVTGDDKVWARIEAAAGAFSDEDAARRHFAMEFAPVHTWPSRSPVFLEVTNLPVPSAPPPPFGRSKIAGEVWGRSTGSESFPPSRDKVCRSHS